MAEARAVRVAIIGAGLTGLTAAWRLRAAGAAVAIYEQSQQVGGRTLSIRKNGFVFDVGAITMLPTYVHTCALIDELGIADHLHRITPVIGIPRNGSMHRIDVGHPLKSLLATQLISTRSKFKLLKLLKPMLYAWKHANYQSLAPLAAWDKETIASYVRRELGEELHEYIVGPIIRGNTLNATESAPAGELLWMLRQYAAPYLYGFDQGINFLAETLGQRLPVQFGTEILSVTKQGEGVQVSGRTADGEFTEAFDACVIGLPPEGVLKLAPSLTARQRQFLADIKPLCSVSVHLGLRQRPAINETFILPPHSEQANLTTIVMDHLKAPGRAPEGKGTVSMFCRDDWGLANARRPDAEILDAVLTMAQPFVGDLRKQIETYVVQRWPYAIIKSEVGLYEQIRAYEADSDAADRVQSGGDFLSMGMEAAVSAGMTMAQRIGQQLNLRQPGPAAGY